MRINRVPGKPHITARLVHGRWRWDCILGSHWGAGYTPGEAYRKYSNSVRWAGGYRTRAQADARYARQGFRN